jgi:hypothetical protein
VGGVGVVVGGIGVVGVGAGFTMAGLLEHLWVLVATHFLAGFGVVEQGSGLAVTTHFEAGFGVVGLGLGVDGRIRAAGVPMPVGPL